MCTSLYRNLAARLQQARRTAPGRSVYAFLQCIGLPHQRLGQLKQQGGPIRVILLGGALAELSCSFAQKFGVAAALAHRPAVPYQELSSIRAHSAAGVEGFDKERNRHLVADDRKLPRPVANWSYTIHRKVS
jgi:hypothetical protein